MARYRLDPVFDRTPDGAVKGIIRYDIYLDDCCVGSRSKHAQCHALLDELMGSTSESGRLSATIHQLNRVARREGRECAAWQQDSARRLTSPLSNRPNIRLTEAASDTPFFGSAKIKGGVK